MTTSVFWLNLGGCAILLGMVVIAIVLVSILSIRHRKAEAAKARTGYEDSLSELRKDPKNNLRREETIRLGQFYSRLTVNRAGVPVFSESDMMKDIDAICPKATHLPTPEPLEERLEQLKRYRGKGLLTEQEYLQKRQELIDQDSPADDSRLI